jgi:hypothetical protein
MERRSRLAYPPDLATNQRGAADKTFLGLDAIVDLG